MRNVLLLLTLTSLTACTHWETRQVLGDRREVGRRLVGSPQIEEVTTRSIAGGAGASTSMSGRTSTAAVAGAQETVKRTHCVQQAEVDFAQDITYEAQLEGRRKDVWSSLLIGGAGVAIAFLAYTQYHQALDDCRDGICSEIPKEPTLAYAAGGAAVAFGGGWLVYSFAALPKGEKPVTPPTQKKWTETQYVESTGCGLVPGDRAPATP